MSDTEDELRAQLVGFFFEEASEGLEIIEAGLVALDLAAPDSETIDSIFRAMHSIKGASGSFGFTDISNFAHHAETLLDEVRDGSRALSRSVTDILLKATDCIADMVGSIQDESEFDSQAVESVATELQAMLDTVGGAEATSGAAADAQQSSESAEEAPAVKEWRIDFCPHEGLLKTGNDPYRILREIAELGEVVVAAECSALPHFADLDPEECHLKWQITLESDCESDAIEEAFAWVEDECDLTIDCGTGESTTAEADNTPPAPSQAQQASEAKSAATGGKAPPTKSVKAGAANSIRVGTDKVDALINMVGELVITQSMLNQIGDKFGPEHLERLMDGLAELERNTRELQDAVMKIRMLPISVTFARFPRLVRDLSQSLGKDIELELVGEGTELDKTVLEQIGDPLVHLVRNSLDHGLETPEERKAAGKPETGTITLAAYHEGGAIVVLVKDDGRGLDRERIREKAIKRGLIGANDPCDDQKVSELILGAGFSTAEQVSDVSGRGVGMDVVKRNIKDLGGTIGIQSTQGEGTTTTIRLPLTLAILDGQLIRLGSETYVVPITGIVESLQIKVENVNSIAGMMEVYRLRDEPVPIIRLHQLFAVEPDTHVLNDGLLVIVESNGRKAGLVVDELLNQQQVVIKSLESNYKRVEGLSGATILGDGTVALIIDIVGLMERVRSQGLFTRKANADEKARTLAEMEGLVAGLEPDDRDREAPAALKGETDAGGSTDNEHEVMNS